MLASGIGSLTTKGPDNSAEGKFGKFRKNGKLHQQEIYHYMILLSKLSLKKLPKFIRNDQVCKNQG